MRICLLAIFTGWMSIAAIADTNLAGFQWKNRVLVILAPSDKDPRLKKQQAIDTEAAAGFSERDVIVVAEIGSVGPLHREFNVTGNDFQVMLIGKDGHTTLKWPQPISAEELYSVIDAMPMRRDEIRRQKKG